MNFWYILVVKLASERTKGSCCHRQHSQSRHFFSRALSIVRCDENFEFDQQIETMLSFRQSFSRVGIVAML